MNRRTELFSGRETRPIAWARCRGGEGDGTMMRKALLAAAALVAAVGIFGAWAGDAAAQTGRFSSGASAEPPRSDVKMTHSPSGENDAL